MTDVDLTLKLLTWPYPDIETYKREVETPEMPRLPNASLIAGGAARLVLRVARWIGFPLGIVKKGLWALDRRAGRVRWCLMSVEERRRGTGFIGLGIVSAYLILGLTKK